MKNFTIFIAALIAILIRVLVFTLKIGLIVGAVVLVISLCSCSASRATSADTLATESLTVGEGRTDSVAHKTLASIFADKTIELTDLSITFQPMPSTLNSRIGSQVNAFLDHQVNADLYQQSNINTGSIGSSVNDRQANSLQLSDPESKTVSTVPSGATKNNGVAHPRIRAQPLQVTVGKLTVSEKSASTIAESTDSVASESKELQADRSSHELTGDKRSTSSIATACRLILTAFILSGLIIGYIIYRRRRSRQST